MAVYKIFPEKDTTIYSEFPNLNTGLDAILEIKNTAPPITNSPQVARALVQFPSDKMDEVVGLILNTNVNPIPGPVPPGSPPNGVYSASLKLYIAEAYNLPDNYTLYCYAASQSWQAGTGRYLYDPAYTQDCNWINRDNSNAWLTSSFFTNTTASFAFDNPGGGTWWTNYVGSQSFVINTTKDTNINVTDIVESFTTPGFLVNNGLILKFEDPYEFNASSSYSLKFFSKDTHTIYLPQLEFGWDDSVYVTGSLTSSLFGKTPKERLIFGTMAGTTVGLMKEIFDHSRSPNSGNFCDLLCTTAGSFAGAMVVNFVINKSSKKKTYKVSIKKYLGTVFLNIESLR
jgi:ribosomal protein L33